MNQFKQIEDQELQAKQFGFYWETIEQLLEQIQNECAEVKEAYEKQDNPHLEEEIGDLLQAAVSLAIFCQIDPSVSLSKSIKKFQQRYDKVVALAKQDGLDSLQNQPSERLMSYWLKAKQST